MKKKILCLLLGVWLCISFALPMYAIDGTINADDEVELITPRLEATTIPTGAVAIARNLYAFQTYYYRVNGNLLLPNDDDSMCEAGWIPKNLSINGVIGEENRTLVSNTQVAPFSAIAYTFTLYPSGYYSHGTATMISPNVALTAAHCLYNKDEGGWPRSVLVYPAVSGSADAQNLPYGYASAQEIAISVPFFEHENSPNYDPITWEASHDWGVIRLSSNIGNSSGYLGFQYVARNAEGFSTTISGYPGDLNGYTEESPYFLYYNQYMATNIIDSDDSSITTIDTDGNLETTNDQTLHENRMFAYKTDATGGQSGAPILYYTNGAYHIIGIHSMGRRVNNVYTYNKGFGITSQLFSFLLAYKN